MKRVIRLTESDLTRIVRRVIMEEDGSQVASEFTGKFTQYRLGADDTNSGKVTYAQKRVEGGAVVAQYNCKTNNIISKTTGYVDQMLPYLKRYCNAL